MATDPTNRNACLSLAQRAANGAGDWTQQDWTAQLTEDAVERGDPLVTHYRPYATAIAYLQRPDRVTSRTEGDVREDYEDVTSVLEYLRGRSAEWDAALPPDASAVNLTASFTGWG